MPTFDAHLVSMTEPSVNTHSSLVLHQAQQQQQQQQHCLSSQQQQQHHHHQQQQQNNADLQELEAIHQLVQEGKAKANEICSNLKNTEGASQRLGNHFVKTQKEINEAFQYYANAMEERKAEILRDLEAVHSSRQAGVALYTEKSQETVEKIYQVSSC